MNQFYLFFDGKRFHGRIIVSTALYAVEDMEYGSSREEIKCNGVRCLRSMCKLMHMNEVRNEEVQRRTGVTRVGWSSRAMC